MPDPVARLHDRAAAHARRPCRLADQGEVDSLFKRGGRRCSVRP